MYTMYELMQGQWLNTKINITFIITKRLFLYTRKLKYKHFTPAFCLQNNLLEFTIQKLKFRIGMTN